MAYTKTNIIKTLDNAMNYLRGGWIKEAWQCHIATRNFVTADGDFVRSGEEVSGKTLAAARANNACSLKCCAQGALELATGANHRMPEKPYYDHVLSLVDNKSIDLNGVDVMEFNDRQDTKLGDVLKVFKAVKKDLQES